MTRTLRHRDLKPVHPGEVLRKDAFPAFGITKPALADALGVSRQTLHEIMSLKRGVSPEIAIRLEAVIGSTAETWLAMQAAHDLWEARTRVSLKGLKKLHARGPVKKIPTAPCACLPPYIEPVSATLQRHQTST